MGWSAGKGHCNECKEGGEVTITCAHDRTGGGKHFWHSRSSLGSFVSNDNHHAFRDFFTIQTCHHQFFTVVDLDDKVGGGEGEY